MPSRKSEREKKGQSWQSYMDEMLRKEISESGDTAALAAFEADRFIVSEISSLLRTAYNIDITADERHRAIDGATFIVRDLDHVIRELSEGNSWSARERIGDWREWIRARSA